MDGSYDLYIHKNPERRYPKHGILFVLTMAKTGTPFSTPIANIGWKSLNSMVSFRGVTSMIYLSHGLEETFYRL